MVPDGHLTQRQTSVLGDKTKGLKIKNQTTKEKVDNINRNTDNPYVVLLAIDYEITDEYIQENIENIV